MNESTVQRMGILVGGGPAPGINGVIHSATIEAVNHGLEVVGIMDGFKHLIDGRLISQPLTIAGVSRIYAEGGSILRTTRANPTKPAEKLQVCARTLANARISMLVGIGGDDTAYALYRVTKAAGEMGLNLRSVHVPKTIDNDLPLPEGIPTFGFETARALGARLVTTIMEDALTTQHWFLVVTMGRSSGHLALGIGKSAGATLTIIPEEWQGQPIHLQEVVDILVTSIILRAASDRPHGVAVIAEGVASNLVAEELRKFEGVSLGEFEHIKLEDIKLSDVLKRAVRRDLGKLGMDKVQLRDKEMGYELRCAEPIAYDVDYARSLGQAATDFLLSGDSNATISLQFNQVKAIPSEEIIDVQTGKIQVRKVNIDSFAYRSAYNFMIRLKPEHAHDPLLLERMARQTNKSTEEFIARYGYLVGLAPRPPEVG